VLPVLDDHAGDPTLRAQYLRPAFLWACEFGRVGAARLLLEHGADIRGQDDNGQTGLHLAAIGGHTTMVRFLLERGAPLDVENAWGGNPLTTCCGPPSITTSR
jgi:ankyrin repeat protein